MVNEGDSRPLLQNVRFVDNVAAGEGAIGEANYDASKQAGKGGDGEAFGGALANLPGSEPILENVHFTGNRTLGDGSSNGSEMRDTPLGGYDPNVSYSGNGTSRGGAVYHAGGSVSWVNLTFARNESSASGGDSELAEYVGYMGGNAYAYGGAIYLANGSLFVTNAVFHENKLIAHGGMGGIARKPLSGNLFFPGLGGDAYGQGGAIYAEEGQLVLTHVTLADQRWNIVGGEGGMGQENDGSPFYGEDGLVSHEGSALYTELPASGHDMSSVIVSYGATKLPPSTRLKIARNLYL